MKRSTLVTITLFVVLLGTWFWSNRRPSNDGPPPLAVQGYVKGVSLQDIKILNKDEDSPYTKFTISRKNEVIKLSLAPGQKGVKVADRQWDAVRTAGDDVLKTHAQAYRVRLYNQVLALSFRASYSFKAKPEELAEYGLDDEHAVIFKAEGGDREVSLKLGRLQKTGDGDTESSTWVMNPELPDVVYRVAGRDLRTELAAPWKDIREPKLFNWKLPLIDHIILSNPNDTKAAKVEMKRPALSEAEKKKLADAEAAKDKKIKKDDKKKDGPRKANEGWVISSPTGYPPGEIGDWLESLSRMQATDYRPLIDGKLPKNTGLDKSKGIRISVGTGDQLETLIIGAKSDNKDQDVWVQVVGRKELYLVASWSTDQCIKKLDSLRDQRLLGARQSAHSKTFELRSPNGSLKATREGDHWRAKGMIVDSKKIDNFLRDLDGMRVEYDSDKTRASVGLDAPAYDYVFEINGQPTRLSVGPKRGEDTWGVIDDGDVFKLQSWSATQVQKKPSDFNDRHLVSFQKGEVRVVTIQSKDGDKETYTHSPDGSWVNTKKPTLKLKTAAIDGLITTLTEMSFEKKFPKTKPNTKGLTQGYHSLSVQLPLNRRIEVRISQQEKKGLVWAAVYRNGALSLIGTINAMNATSLRKSSADFQ